MTKKLKNKEISIGWDVGGWSGKNHGFCVLEGNDNKIKLIQAEKLSIYQIKERIEDIIDNLSATHQISLGIDAPLQFPTLFKKIIAENPINIFQQVNNNKKENPIAWRATDLHIKAVFGKTPLSPSFSFLTSNATVAISLIGELKATYDQFSVLPFDQEKEINALEVYPGLLKSTILFNHKIFRKFENILKHSIFNKIEGFDYYFKGNLEKTDVADAVICAIYALGWNGNIDDIPILNRKIPASLYENAEKEGWIYYPKID